MLPLQIFKVSGILLLVLLPTRAFQGWGRRWLCHRKAFQRCTWKSNLVLQTHGKANDEVKVDASVEKQEWMSDDRIIKIQSRRNVLAGVTTIILAPLAADRCWAADAATNSPFMVAPQFQKAESAELDVGLSESRVTENVLSPPSYGMEAPDIFYPSWFKGEYEKVRGLYFFLLNFGIFEFLFTIYLQPYHLYDESFRRRI